MYILTFGAVRYIATRSLAIPAIAVCALLSTSVQANERYISVRETVTTAGLDVSQPAGAQQLYYRLFQSASLVCGRSLRVDLKAVDNLPNCIESSVAHAVRSANLPQLTMVYLKMHAMQAANYGITVPTIIAAK
jgi:UrcA family protein